MRTTSEAEEAVRPDMVRWTLYLAAFVGLAAGFGETLVRSLMPWAPPWGIRMGGYLLWMPATANLLLFLAAGMAICAIVLWRPAIVNRQAVAFLFGAPAALNVLVLFSPPLHLWSALILAAGFAAILARHHVRVGRFAHSAVAPLLVLTLLLAVGVEALRFKTARDVPQFAGSPQGPNVLLLVLDNVRAVNLSAHGYFRETTPVLDELAREGVLFERAFSTSSWSLPSHASLMTGRWAHELEASWKVPLDDSHPTLAEVLSESGYRTAGFVGNGAYTQRESGIARGFSYYEDYPLTFRQVMMSSRLGNRIVTFWDDNVIEPVGARSRIYDRRSAGDLHDRLLRWLDRNEGYPFFAFVNYFDAHLQYFSPDDISVSPTDVPDNRPEYDPSLPFAPHDLLEGYDLAIAGMDRELGHLFDALDVRGLLDNTLVIVTSDHGEEFEEHDVFGHGNTLYEPALRVPLILRQPGGLPAGIRVEAPVSNKDIAATVTDHIGIDAPQLPGCTLARHWSGDQPPRSEPIYGHLRQGINTPPEFPVSRGDMTSILEGRWHLIVNGDGAVELYDVIADPWEQQDLAPDPGFATELSRIQALASTLPMARGCVDAVPSRTN